MKTIIITPEMVPSGAPYGGASIGTTGQGFPCFNFPNGVTSVVPLRIPIPSDWDGTTMKIQTIYTSDGLSGAFQFAVQGSGFYFDDDAPHQFNTGGAVLLSPTDIDAPTNNELGIDFGNSFPAPCYLNIITRRVGTSVNDTSTDNLKVTGFILYYSPIN